MRFYRGIIFNKENLEKITGTKSLKDYNIKFAVRLVERLYEKNFSTQEIEKLFGVSKHLINKILRRKYRKPETWPDLKNRILEKKVELAHSLENRIGKAIFCKLLNNFNLQKKDVEVLLNKIYELWQKVGTFQVLAIELGISGTEASQIIHFIKENEIIEKFEIPKRTLTEQQKRQIIKTKELYDELKTLSRVGRRLGLTRERVRQILERGNNYGLIEYEPSPLKRFDEITEKITKEKLMELLIEHGSKNKVLSNLKNELKISMGYLNVLIKLYDIDFEDLVLQNRKNKCLSEYEEMRQELGDHPTTTIMAKNPKWRSIWARVSKIWGTMDNFRKEFGIPIPGKGNPQFREIVRETTEKRSKIKEEKLRKIIEFINQNSPTNFREMRQNLDILDSPLYRYLKILRDDDRVDWNYYRGKIRYYKKLK